MPGMDPQVAYEYGREQGREQSIIRRQQAQQQARQGQQQAGAQRQQDYDHQLMLLREQGAQREREQLIGIAGQQDNAAQQANIQAALASHHVDLQARLQEVTLNQDENMRLQKLHHARAAVEDNPDLSPAEQRMLITQIESGLNPLENRQRETQILQSHVQTQAMAQQSDQQATLFAQRQARVQAGAEERMRTITDPATGLQQRFYMTNDGEWQPLDFSNSYQMHQARLEAVQAGTEATQQGTAIQGVMAPGALEAQQLGNQGAQLGNQRTQLLNQHLGQTMQFAQDLHPQAVQHAQLANQALVQQIAHGADSHQLAQTAGYAHLDNLRMQMAQAAQINPHNVNLASANVELANANLEHLRFSNASAEDVQAAQAELNAARLAQIRAQTHTLTQGTTQAGRAGDPYQQRLPNGDMVYGIYDVHGNPQVQTTTSSRLMPQHYTAVQGQVQHEMAAERRSADTNNTASSRRPAWMRTPEAETAEYERRVNHRVELLRRWMQQHPAQRPGEAPAPNPGAQNAFDADAANAMRP